MLPGPVQRARPAPPKPRSRTRTPKTARGLRALAEQRPAEPAIPSPSAITPLVKLARRARARAYQPASPRACQATDQAVCGRIMETAGIEPAKMFPASIGRSPRRRSALDGQRVSDLASATLGGR